MKIFFKAVKLTILVFFGIIFFQCSALAQDNGSKKKKGNTQADLDQMNQEVLDSRKTKEQKEAEKAQKKQKQEKEKRDKQTRKRAEKVSNKRLNSAKSKVGKKKKNYVKTH
ncbi:MAG: hypothetical protein ACK40G_11300 [Cytophagaceae bacterium]